MVYMKIPTAKFLQRVLILTLAVQNQLLRITQQALQLFTEKTPPKD